MEQRQFWGPYGAPLTAPPQAQAMNGLFQGPAFVQMPMGNLPPPQIQTRLPTGVNPPVPMPVAPQAPGFQQMGLFGVPILPPGNPAMFPPQNFLQMPQLNINAPTFCPLVGDVTSQSATTNSVSEKPVTPKTPVAITNPKPGFQPTAASTSTTTNPGPSTSTSSSSSLEVGVPTSVIFIEGSPTSMQLQLKNEALIGSIQSELRTAAIDRNFAEKFALRSEPKVSLSLVEQESSRDLRFRGS